MTRDGCASHQAGGRHSGGHVAAGATPTLEAMHAIVSQFDASGLSEHELGELTNVGVTETLQRFRSALSQEPH